VIVAMKLVIWLTPGRMAGCSVTACYLGAAATAISQSPIMAPLSSCTK
jgi:hypothetical protein